MTLHPLLPPTPPSDRKRRLYRAACLLPLLMMGCRTETTSWPTPPPTAQAPSRPDAEADAAARRNAFDIVYFDYDKSNLRSDQTDKIERAASYLRQHPELRITITGHTDERGTREYNLALGERRAEAVRLALLGIGVGQGQIAQTISYGKERPAVLGSDEAAWAQNRRAVMAPDEAMTQ